MVRNPVFQSGNPDPDTAALTRYIAGLEARLAESEETLDAIRRGDVDALVVGDVSAQRVFTLDSADRPYRVLIEQIGEGAVTLGEDGTVLYCNRRLADMLGVSPEQIVGHNLAPFAMPQDQPLFLSLIAAARHSSSRGELSFCKPGGDCFPVYFSVRVLQADAGVPLLCGVLTDLTGQKLHLRELAQANARLLAESAERERVEQQLRQAQKMEAVGQLTGGLAHDFNNLLTGIAGSLELLATRVAQGRTGDLDRYIAAAQGASRRAAALTHRLLAFSRKQTLDPKPTDLNRLVAGMEDLIRRTVGPAIRLETVAAGGLWTALVDPNQVENALLNLCINARDAMPQGGALTVETGNKWLDEFGASARDLLPGQYATLCVSDTGHGMAPDVAARAFEPFFTTKPIGQGTGLGLSMIYGFARQSGGQVQIYSEPGQGTMVCLYLPRHHGSDIAGEPAAQPPLARAGRGETVLIVDDEPTVRMLIAEVLQDLGYTVIEAIDGPSGIGVLKSAQPIELLVTDVGLPGGMNGRQVAETARRLRPAIKVLFVTGFAENAVLGHGHLDPGMHILTKPFAMATLAARVQQLIKAP